jgi:Cu-Zn family superoxide dismutase
MTIAGLTNPIIGRAVVVHADPDTGIQPAGGAGARIGVGTIGIANPASP